MREGPRSVGDIAARLPVSRPGVSKHLRILERAALVTHESIALGVGGVVGAGYEWWVSDEWSVGAMARLQLMRTRADLEVGAGATYTTILPVVMLTAVYH